jgi:hypothetical protein
MTSGQNVTTMINVFTVEADNQQNLVDLLTQAAENIMSKQPGYLASRIHRSLDCAGLPGAVPRSSP